MPPQATPSSEDLARYLEARGELSKPWMLQLLRLTKLNEARGSLSHQEYEERLREAHADLMRVSDLWRASRQEKFDGSASGPAPIEPLPGSPEDR